MYHLLFTISQQSLVNFFKATRTHAIVSFCKSYNQWCSAITSGCWCYTSEVLKL